MTKKQARKSDRARLQLVRQKRRRLEKAAPDLLKALEEIALYENARRKSCSMDPGTVPKGVVCKIAEQAVTKAKGK